MFVCCDCLFISYVLGLDFVGLLILFVGIEFWYFFLWRGCVVLLWSECWESFVWLCVLCGDYCGLCC